MPLNTTNVCDIPMKSFEKKHNDPKQTSYLLTTLHKQKAKDALATSAKEEPKEDAWSAG